MGKPDAIDKLARYPLVPEGDFPHTHGANDNDLLTAALTDAESASQWEVYQLLIGTRWSDLRQSKAEYAENTGLNKGTIGDSEKKEKKAERPTIAGLLNYWRELGLMTGKNALPPELKRKLEETRDMVLRLRIPAEDSETIPGLYDRWAHQVPDFYGPTAGTGVSGLTPRGVWQQRDLQKRIFSVKAFHEVVAVAEKCGRNITDASAENFDAFWHDDARGTWTTESLANLKARGVSDPVAAFHTYAQLAGIRTDGTALAATLGRPKAAKVLANFEIVPFPVIAPVTDRLRDAMGATAYGVFETRWEDELKQESQRTTFSSEVQRIQAERGITNVELARVFDLGKHIKHKPSQHVINVREGEQSPLLSAGQLAYAVAPNLAAAQALWTLFTDEVTAKARRIASETQRSKLRPLRNLWGISGDQMIDAAKKKKPKIALATRADLLHLEQHIRSKLEKPGWAALEEQLIGVVEEIAVAARAKIDASRPVPESPQIKPVAAAKKPVHVVVRAAKQAPVALPPKPTVPAAKSALPPPVPVRPPQPFRYVPLPPQEPRPPSSNAIMDWVRETDITFLALYGRYQGLVDNAVERAWKQDKTAPEKVLIAAAMAELRRLASKQRVGNEAPAD